MPKPNKITGRKVVFGLPECQVYTHIFSLPVTEKIKNSDLWNLVAEEAGKNIPLKKEDIILSYKVLSKSESDLEILLVATSREVVREWQNFFQELKLTVDFFDIETIALFRDLFSKKPVKPVCLIDLGAATTNIAIFNKIGLCYSYTINTAGEIFSQEIAKILEISLEEAEQKKIETGLNKKDKKIYPIICRFLDEIIAEVKIAISYVQQKYNQDEKIEKNHHSHN